MLERIQTNNMQLMRIAKHPLQTEEMFVVVDNLESGELRIYEHISGSLNVQQLLSGYREIENAVLVAKIIINELWKEKGIFIHKILCEYGYEEILIEPMIYQVLNFAEFYNDYQAVGISDKEYETWFPYAKEPLKGFKRENRVYEYQTGNMPDLLEKPNSFLPERLISAKDKLKHKCDTMKIYIFHKR